MATLIGDSKATAFLHLVSLTILAATVVLQGLYIPQTAFTGLLTTTIVITATYFWVHRPQIPLQLYRWNILFGILLRAACIFILPWLSDDVFRFIWDGKLIHAGINPYVYRPDEWIKITTDSTSWAPLYHLLNSPQYYSAYPPVAQFTYFLTTWIPAGQSWLMASLGLKLILFFAELVNIFLLKALLKDDHKVSLYAIHPVIIIEGVGNLHYEILLVTFLLLFIKALKAQHFRWSGTWWALAIGAKLTPAMYLPIIYRFLPMKSRRPWIISTAIILAILMVPLLHPDILINFATSLDLYFRKFEFNAGLYYLVRQIGLWVSGYNLIQFIGPALSLITVIALIVFSLRQKSRDGRMLIQHLFWVHLIYLWCGTTIHPWYIIIPALWGMLAGWYFPLVWLFLSWLSYSHYHHGMYHERMGWVALEYVLLAIAIWVEWRVKKQGMYFSSESLL